MTVFKGVTLKDAGALFRFVLQDSKKFQQIYGGELNAPSRAKVLTEFGLPAVAIRFLEKLQPHKAKSETQRKAVLKSLAVRAAGIASVESEKILKLQASLRSVDVKQALNDLFSNWNGPIQRGEINLSQLNNPEGELMNFRTVSGTRVAFFANPSEMRPWARFIEPHWSRGLRLVVFHNPHHNVGGLLFIHGLGRVSWSRMGEKSWHCVGGTEVQPFTGTGFAEVLENVVRRGAEMTWIWRFVDESLKAGKAKKVTHAGGMFATVFTDDRSAAVSVYAELLKTLGLCVTWAERQADKDWMEQVSRKVPLHTCGNMKSDYKGLGFTGYRAHGYAAVLQMIETEQFGGHHPSLLLQGYGDIASQITMRRDMIPSISGIFDTDIDRLEEACKQRLHIPLYLDRAGKSPSLWQKIRHGREIKIKNGLDDVLASRTGGRSLSSKIFFSDPDLFPIEFKMLKSLVEGGLACVLGRADDDLSSLISQASGVLFLSPAIDRLGPTAAISHAIGLPSHIMNGQTHFMGETVRHEYWDLFRKQIPPRLHALARARESWRQMVVAGEGLGGI